MVPWKLKWPTSCKNVIEEILFFDTVYWNWWQSFKRKKCKFDKLACITDFFETVNEKNASMTSPSPNLGVDETLYPYRGSAGIKQHKPNKPAKNGLLYRSLYDAVVPCTFYRLQYARKLLQTNNEASKYYISGIDEYTKYLVNSSDH